jgi:uncharacterized membrane protein YccC
MVLDNAVIAAILSFLGGAIVKGIVNALKMWLKINGGYQAVLLAIVTSAGATAFVLLTGKMFAWLPFLGYSIMVFMISSGIFHWKDDKPV